MRTLKKTLCLVLALVMVLGLCVVNASAFLDDYSDKEVIKYAEEVDVLSGLGILVGYPDGTFKPQQNVTRAEAAKIITYIMIGDSDRADALKATSDPFNDVPATHWAAGYIAYCVQMGIINGVGDGNFNPNNNVTGLEIAKMLLCALGYGVNGEYTGSSWGIQTAKDAVQYGIFDGNLEGVSEDPATREEVALYSFNTLFLAKVTYSTLLGGYIENANQFWNAESNKTANFASDFALHTALDDSDAFYRPTGYYYYVGANSANIISNHYPYFASKTFYTPVSGGMVYDVLGKAIVKDINDGNGEINVYENGVPIDVDLTDIVVRGGNVRIGEGRYGSGYGVETSVYSYNVRLADGTLYRIVDICIVHSYLGQVSSVKAASARNDAYITINFPRDSDDESGYINAFDNKEYTTEKFAKGDYVLFTYSFRRGYDCIIDVKAAEVITSKITSWTSVTGSEGQIGANGQKYNVAFDDYVLNAKQTRGSKLNYAFVNGTTYTIFADWNGNVIGVDATATNKKFVYVTGFGFKRTTTEDDLSESQALTVQFVDGDGATQVRFLSQLTYFADFDFMGFDNLYDAWEFCNLNALEQELINYLNSLDNNFAGNVMHYSLDRWGDVLLTDLETLAWLADEPSETQPYTYGENNYEDIARVYRGVALLGEDMVAIDDYDLNIHQTNRGEGVYGYDLLAATDTVFFFVNNGTTAYYGKHVPSEVKVYKGISSIPYNTVTVNGKAVSIYTLDSWYAEADVPNYKAYAQVAKVSYEEAAAPAADGPVYLYLNMNYTTNDAGSYTKIDNGDGTFTVEFYVFKAGQDEATTITKTYDNEMKADDAIIAAEALVYAWVLETRTGLAEFGDGVMTEKYSSTDKTTYVELNTDDMWFGIEETPDGATIFYYIDGHNKGVEITSDELIFDLTGLGINSISELKNYIDEGVDFVLMMAYNPKNLTVTGLYLIMPY